VETLVRVARAVERTHPGGWLSIGDLCHRGGGGSPEHRSHQSGRDFDIFLPAVKKGWKRMVPPFEIGREPDVSHLLGGVVRQRPPLAPGPRTPSS
jgi:hypothetical protein